ncbi:hypothetical protein ACQKJC_24645 [Priestia koreensis]|uniref:hypothetical protein n=1 Tax=Priestia koreensis TaxID=284581 RepID=UPI003D05F43A
MKACEFVLDMSLGQVLNENAGENKEYVVKILDLLYEHFDRVRYVNDLSASVTGKNGWSVMVSEKFAMMDKRVPIP